jgi:hypothetical protein
MYLLNSLQRWEALPKFALTAQFEQGIRVSIMLM